MWHIWGSRGLHIVCTWGNLKQKRPHRRPVHRWEDIKKKRGWDGMDWFIRLRVGTSSGL